MTHAARWTRLIAALATLCGGAVGISVDSEGAETTRTAEVIAIGPAGTWTQTLTRDCAVEASAVTDTAPLAVLRYRDGSRFGRRWRTARVPAIAGTRVGDSVRFDPASCSVSPRVD